MIEAHIHEPKIHLSRLLARVAAGEEVVIAKPGQPLARLVPYGVPAKDCKPGLAAGLVEIAADLEAPPPSSTRSASRCSTSRPRSSCLFPQPVSRPARGR